MLSLALTFQKLVNVIDKRNHLCLLNHSAYILHLHGTIRVPKEANQYMHSAYILHLHGTIRVPKEANQYMHSAYILHLHGVIRLPNEGNQYIYSKYLGDTNKTLIKLY